MRKVFVQCNCDTCGRVEITKSSHNIWHNLYEDSLPDGWNQFDNEEFPWIEFDGDQCPECQKSFAIYINNAFNEWRKFVMNSEKAKNYEKNNDNNNSDL